MLAYSSPLEAIELTRRQQYVLFADKGAELYRDSVRLYDRHIKSDATDAPSWEQLDFRIQTVFVDLRYRGDNHAASRAFLAESIRSNDFDAFCDKMKDKTFWKPGDAVPRDRFNLRVEYLRKSGASSSCTVPP